MQDEKPAAVFFEGSQPILRVEDMNASLRFYVDQLGFKNVHWGTDEFTSVNRDRAGIYLCKGSQGAGKAWIWIGVEDVEKLQDARRRPRRQRDSLRLGSEVNSFFRS